MIDYKSRILKDSFYIRKTPKRLSSDDDDDDDHTEDSRLLENPTIPTQIDEPVKQKKFPKCVAFIVLNEFCERFNYYGMRAVLTLYLLSIGLTDNESTIVYHTFSFFCYFTALFGAILADSYIGKFRTIVYLSIVYAIGSILMAVEAIPNSLPPAAFVPIGLILIALGTGGIKPCVSAFGGDQFDEDQVIYRQRFFSVFYFSINVGSLISIFITPIMRADAKCFGDDTCYPLAFGIPAGLMIFSIIVFVSGSSLYRKFPPEGNVVVNVSKCMWYALRQKCKSKGVKRDHWLDYADDKYDTQQIQDIRQTLSVLKLYVPLPLFWALFDQQGSRWVIQALYMGNYVSSGWTVKPDQLQALNPLLIVICIPLFDMVLYPMFRKCNILTNSLRRILYGGLLAGVAFIVSACIQLKIEAGLPVPPSEGSTSLQVLSLSPCNINDVSFYSVSDSYSLSFGEVHQWGSGPDKQDLFLNNKQAFMVDVKSSDCTFTNQTISTAGDGNVVVLGNFGNKLQARTFDMKVEKKMGGKDDKDAYVRAIYIQKDTIAPQIDFWSSSKSFNLTNQQTKPGLYSTSREGVDAGTYQFRYADGTKTYTCSLWVQLGGTYDIVIDPSRDKGDCNTFMEVEANDIHVGLQIPQYVVITVAEIMFSITGLEFSYSQAPTSMRAILTAGWLLAVAVGNLIVVIITEIKFFEDQSSEYFLFAGLMIFVMGIFFLLARKYKKIDKPNDENEDTAVDNKSGVELKEKANGGLDNSAFEDDQKDNLKGRS